MTGRVRPSLCRRMYRKEGRHGIGAEDKRTDLSAKTVEKRRILSGQCQRSRLPAFGKGETAVPGVIPRFFANRSRAEGMDGKEKEDVLLAFLLGSRYNVR